MKYFFDTEFLETGSDAPIHLISIGIVSEDGRQYYAELDDYPKEKLTPWLIDNVVPYLRGNEKPRAQVAKEIIEFIGSDEDPVFWAYFASYDWVLFCQIFGRMIDLPKNFPMYVYDFKVLMDMKGIDKRSLPVNDDAHDALADASWLKQSWDSIFF